jgi:hypothetical protein
MFIEKEIVFFCLADKPLEEKAEVDIGIHCSPFKRAFIRRSLP